MGRARASMDRLPDWFKVLLVGSALWLGVALVRGVTFALTHATHTTHGL